LLTEVIDAPEARAKAKGLSFGRTCLTGLPDTVSGDSSKLRQVLGNLLDNAVKFTGAGEVALSATEMGPGQIRFAVSDTGPGIPPSELPRLFQPFHRATDRSQAPQPGTGLGLAITRRLVAVMGGEILVTSEVGRGSCFWFDLQLPSAAVPSLPAAPVLGPKHLLHGQGRRILVVDDVTATRDFLFDLLQPLGFSVERAASAEDALPMLARLDFDLLILDLRLPGMSGQELARRLRQEKPGADLKILAASASALGLHSEEALVAGCDDFIAKPFLIEELLQKVSRLLGPDGSDVPARDAGRPTARLNRSILERLQTAAQEGDVMRLRWEIERLRAAGAVSPALDEIERRAGVFDVDGIVAVTSSHLRGASEESPVS
jgi:CheY-like chemotaxis protein